MTILTTEKQISAIEFAGASKYAYKFDQSSPEGFVFIDHSKNLLPEIKTGYFGAVYQHIETGKYVFSHRGS